MFGKIDFRVLIFYFIALSIVAVIVVPSFLSEHYDKYIAQNLDRISLSWLQRRGLEFSEEEQVGEPEPNS